MWIVLAYAGQWLTCDGLTAEEVRARMLDPELLRLVRVEWEKGYVVTARGHEWGAVHARMLELAPQILEEVSQRWEGMPILMAREVAADFVVSLQYYGNQPAERIAVFEGPCAFRVSPYQGVEWDLGWPLAILAAGGLGVALSVLFH